MSVRIRGWAVGVVLVSSVTGCSSMGGSAATVTTTVTRTRDAIGTVTVRTTATTVVQVPTTVTVTVVEDLADGLTRTSRVFDAGEVEAGVTTILTDSPPDGYGLTGIADVTCPAQQAVVAGTTFNCSLTQDDSARIVTISVVGDDGTYTVGVPH